MISKQRRNSRRLAAIAIAISAATAGVACSSSSDPPASQSAAAAPASQPISGHWVQDQRLRLLMAELSRQNPNWPAGLPQEPEDAAAATQPEQFDEIADLANALAESADHLPAVATHVQMSDADRGGFLAEARALRVQAVELQAAANRRSIEQMQRQIDGINSTCVSCHSRYRDFSGQLNRTQASIGHVGSLAMAGH